MFLKKIQGNFFRNYDQFSLDFSSPINIFYGANGQGKSSLLEAIYCALKGNSFYPLVQHQIVQHHKDKAQIIVDIEEKQGFSDISVFFYLVGKESLRKEIKYCGKKVSTAFLNKKFSCLVFTEESMKCMRSGPEQRRNFIDNMLEKDSSKSMRAQFYKILAEKRSLLKNFKKGLISRKEAFGLLEVLNYNFSKISVHLVEERLKLLKELFSQLQKLKKDFFGEKSPSLGFDYFLSKEERITDESWGDFVKEDIKKKRDLELQLGTPLSGPQRHEIQFLFEGRDSRFFCSRGQQRLFLLSLMGSCIHQASSPFLFLDDVLMELDEKSQKCFLQFLEKKNCQTFLTSCNLISFEMKKTSFFSIKSGTIKKL